MTAVSQVPTPELDKRKAIALDTGAAQTLTDFYDFLESKGWAICAPREDSLTGAYDPVPINPERLFAEFFGIDLNKIEEERRALLAALQQKED